MLCLRQRQKRLDFDDIFRFTQRVIMGRVLAIGSVENIVTVQEQYRTLWSNILCFQSNKQKVCMMDKNVSIFACLLNIFGLLAYKRHIYEYKKWNVTFCLLTNSFLATTPTILENKNHEIQCTEYNVLNIYYFNIICNHLNAVKLQKTAPRTRLQIMYVLHCKNVNLTKLRKNYKTHILHYP